MSQVNEKSVNDNMVISSRIRLARNLKKYPFPSRLTDSAAQEMKEELQEILNSEDDYEKIVKIAKEQLGLYFPDEEIFYNDRNE